MHQMTPAQIAQGERQAIMKAVIDAESVIYTHDVLHRDLHPRNILVHGTPEQPRVFILDFGKCMLWRARDPEENLKRRPGQPISPLLRWYKPRGPQGSFLEWIKGWNWKTWLDSVYESTKKDITRELKEVFLPDSENSCSPGAGTTSQPRAGTESPPRTGTPSQPGSGSRSPSRVATPGQPSAAPVPTSSREQEPTSRQGSRSTSCWLSRPAHG